MSSLYSRRLRLPRAEYALRTMVVLVLIVGNLYIPAVGAERPPPWAAPPLGQANSIRESQSGKTIGLDELVERLAAADVVFLGESHADETTHRLQLELYRELLAKKHGRVVLAMEMFDRDVQGALDRYLAGEIAEEAFLEQTRPWSNYREAYRPLIEEAKAASAPVLASNFPAKFVRQFALEGAEAVDSLSEADRRFLPREFLPNTVEYWKRVDNAVRGHQGMTGEGDSPDDRLFSPQSLWDNSMGEACADAIDGFPEHLVLHVNGEFHSAYHDGVVHQLQLRKPQAQIATVAVVPTSNPATEEVRGRPAADFVAFVEARATNLDRGQRSVYHGRELKYLLHLPSAEAGDMKWPLLIWLPQRGLNAEEDLAYRRALYGDDAAIAVVEPPYRETSRDLSVGRRWFWDDTFAEDVFAAAAGVEEIWAYLLRHYPVDSRRACVAGDGTGATVAAIVATQSVRMDHAAVALDPQEYAQLRDVPLLLLESFGDDPPPQKSLQVRADRSARHWWQNELAQYERAGVASSFTAVNADPWERQRQQENLVRAALQLQQPPEATGGRRAFVLAEEDAPRARHWARLQSLWHAEATGIPTVALEQPPASTDAVAVSTNVSPTAAAKEDVLPRCPGPFGGTTVLVLPDGIEPDAVAAWTAIESHDPLAAASRFHRVRVATAEGDRALLVVLKKLLSENRKNVLIAPATFYAGPARMQLLEDSVKELQDAMTIHWLPGLGGCRGILSH